MNQNILSKLSSTWRINRQNRLFSSYVFNDFCGALIFANKVAKIAEKHKHHPDLKITWGKCDIELWTHDLNAITNKDIELAIEIDQLCY